MKKITLLLLMLVSYSGFAQFPLPYCGPMTFTSNVEPITLVNFAGINNSTSALVGTNNGTTIVAHEDYTTTTGNVTAGSSYPITIKGNTDGNYITYLRVYVDWNQNNDFTDAGESYDIGTIANSTGADAIQLVGSITVPTTALTGNTRMRVIKRYAAYGTSCQTGTGYGQTEDYTLAVAALPADLPDYANLQFPYTATINQGGSVTVYGQVYEGGLTDTTSGQAPGIQAWVGYGTTDANPNTFTTWIPATFNVEVGNNDEYQANLGNGLAVGTYYYATRFQLNGGGYVYGATNFGFWNGTDKVNGVLTVNPPPPPANDECAAAIALTVNPDYACGTVTSGTTLGGTQSLAATPCFGNPDDDVWFSFVATATSHRIVLSNVVAVGGTGTSTDAYMQVLSGVCGSQTSVLCSDPDTGTATGLTIGGTYYVRVYTYGTTNNITFNLCVGTPPPAPANDECSAAIPLTAGGIYSDHLTDGTTSSATTSSQTAPTTCFGFVGGDVWFSVTVPASGSITIETGNSTTGATGLDTVVTAYSGDCSSLIQVGCDDDSAATGAYSLLPLTGLTPGSILLLRVYEYNNDNDGGFAISAYDGSLGNGLFDNANFAYYPNPVKNIFNLSYNQEISSVDVFNLLGQKVSSNAVNANTAQIDMSNLSNGAYMVKVTSNNLVKTIKVIKE
ncbi:T9SS type A sorting domain-containing protein [Flavobacterium sp.]|uniref:T9SS type A sorting domain-containing protein n=1 Tax=Flavobacterium sp. TaxID=239 RepID=UPI0025DC499E|nr:T9SS type A sorting domain-containing protein [Flavobacterium sp.]